jgi:hypothetical protein
MSTLRRYIEQAQHGTKRAFGYSGQQRVVKVKLHMSACTVCTVLYSAFLAQLQAIKAWQGIQGL